MPHVYRNSVDDVNRISVQSVWQRSGMGESNDRLKAARERAGFKSARAAALRFGWTISTYASHENGQTPVPPRAAEIYGRAFKVSAAWILTGEGVPEKPMVPIIGHVGAGAEMKLYAESQGPFEEVPAPEGSTERTVAVEIRGESLGSFFDHWLVYYDDVRSPVTPDLIGKLCVCGLADGRVLVKRIKRSKTRGLWHLESQAGETLFDVPLEWAARVKNMSPR